MITTRDRRQTPKSTSLALGSQKSKSVEDFWLSDAVHRNENKVIEMKIK